MLYKNGVDLYKQLEEFLAEGVHCNIYVPYIKLDALKTLIDGHEHIETVIVRWEPRDLITEASDLKIYPYLRDRGITLYRNPRLHLKAFVCDYKKAFFGSANISRRALNLPESKLYNYELAAVDENLDLADRLYFNTIEAESILITDLIYEQIIAQLPERIKTFPKESDFALNVNYPDKNFSISSLPMTYNVETLYRIYETHESIHVVELNCAMHDLALYRIPLGLSLVDFQKQLKFNFFNHPFVRAFLGYVDDENQTYFGGAKDWIHRNCSDVPTPRKWEITENIQILFRWVVKLSEGVYQVDRPTHSERLFRVTGTDN
jgi:hypothetical protein